MRNRRWTAIVLAGALALAGVLASARAARAASDDIPADEDVRALPQGPLPTARWLTLETPHFELHFYPEEREFAERAARVAERAYRLVTRYLNWQPKGRISVAARSIRPTRRTAPPAPCPTTSSPRSARRPTGWTNCRDFDDFVKLLITHELTHVVHLDTILSWCPRLVDSVLGKIYAPNLSQPTLFIEGLARADGVAPYDRGPPAQQLLRHAPARSVSRRAGAGPRRGVGRVRPARVSGRQRPVPVRLQHPALRRGSLRAREGPRDLAPLCRRVHRRRDQPHRIAGGRPSLHERVRRRTSGTTGAARRPTATRCRRRRWSGAA